jgi:hypothetical protein
MLSELEADWETWLLTLFPTYFTHPFAPHMQKLWEWIWELTPDVRPRSEIAIWSRGATKSTTGEAGVAVTAARGARRYALYVCGTQDQADDHVANIATMLESPRFAIFYPQVAARRLSKYGHSRGWRRNRLRTASGFTIDAIGLDTAARGVKMDEARPDFMLFDDIDDEHDDKRAVEKKEKSLTRKLIPAGSDDLAILGLQNLVHKESIFSKLADGRADFLHDRDVIGPVPAINNLEYTQRKGEYLIISGEPTWIGMSLETCEEYMNDWGLTSFLNEAQHRVTPPPGGMFNHIRYQRVDYKDVVDKFVRIVCWVDPAVSDTDRSDSHAVQVDALGFDDKVYRLYSWEDRTSPRDAIKRALVAAVKFGAESVGIETDQGGDTWDSVYELALKDAEREIGVRVRLPMKSAKAGSIGSKTHRASQMLFDYERDVFRHVRGTHDLLEESLNRFPRTKPYDLVDASYWSWRDLKGLDDQEGVIEDDTDPVVISAY